MVVVGFGCVVVVVVVVLLGWVGCRLFGELVCLDMMIGMIGVVGCDGWGMLGVGGL